jgi:hypothetical protein
MMEAQRARWGGTWRRGGGIKTLGMGCGGGSRGCGPFYRAREAGRQLVGGEMVGGRWSFTPSVFEAGMRGGKAGRHHLGGENEERRAPIQFDYSHMEESSRRRRRLGRDRGRRRPVWADDRQRGQNELGQHENFPRRMVRASNIVWVEMVIGLHRIFFEFSSKLLDSNKKIQISSN